MAKKSTQQRAKKKAKRRRTHDARLVPGPARRGVGAVQVLGPSALATRLSGRVVLCAVASRGPRRSELVLVTGSLLGRGYKGTLGVTLDVPAEELLAKGVPVEELAGSPVGPLDLDEARRLTWGLYAWSARRGTLTKGAGVSPGLGLLPQPPGDEADWEAAFTSSFFPQQLDLADAIAEAPDDWDGPAAERPDVAVLVRFACRTERPISLAAELDQRPLEFVRHGERPGMYLFHPRDGERSPLSPNDQGTGLVELSGDSVLGGARSSQEAVELAARLEELASGPLELLDVRWEPLS